MGASPVQENQPREDAPMPGSTGDPGPEPILCNHCGRTASNGISCQGYCVADSGY